MDDKKYILTKNELKNLLKCKKELNALKCAGVDNWEGYEYAFESEDWNYDECEWDVSKELENYQTYEE